VAKPLSNFPLLVAGPLKKKFIAAFLNNSTKITILVCSILIIYYSLVVANWDYWGLKSFIKLKQKSRIKTLILIGQAFWSGRLMSITGRYFFAGFFVTG